nr:transglycosylase domain-containing protein [Parafrankia colletiae]
MSTPYSQGTRAIGPRAGDGEDPRGAAPGSGAERPRPGAPVAGGPPPPGGPVPGGPGARRSPGAASAGGPPAAGRGGPGADEAEAGGWTPDRGAAARRRETEAATRSRPGSSPDGRSAQRPPAGPPAAPTGGQASGRPGGRPATPERAGSTSRTGQAGHAGRADSRVDDRADAPARPGSGPAGRPATGRAAAAGAGTGSGTGAGTAGGRGYSDRGGSRQTGAGRTGSGRVSNPRGQFGREDPDRGDLTRAASSGPGEPPASGRAPRSVAGRAAAERAAGRPAAVDDRGGRGERGARGEPERRDRTERLSAATTRLRAVRPGGGRPSTPEQPPARPNAIYDTVDQAALSRVDVAERTADATVYRKVTPGGAAGRSGGSGGLDELDDMGRDAGSGPSATARMNGVDRASGPRRAAPGRRPGGPPRPGERDPGGRTGPRSTAAHAAGGRAAAGGRGAARRTQGRRGPKWWRNRPRWFRRLVLIGLTSGSLLFVAGIAVIYAATRVPLPDEVKTDQTSIIAWGSGGEITRIGTVNRTDVPLSQVSKDVQHAVLAAENYNFYNEPGISPKGIARALWVNVTGGEISQGGSTITQQYAKNAYLTQDRTFTRKMREIVLAIKLDRKYSKDQILEFYLNTIYFGRQSYGIEAAAKSYFNKPAAQLTAGEGAVIAGLIRSPNYLDPKENPGPAESRWKDVVATMVAQGWAPASLANEKPPPVLDKDESGGYNSSDQVGYIRDQVKDELEAAGITEDQINRGGLRITTTLDEGRQTAAFQAVDGQLAEAYAAVPDLRTGLVALKPGTGEVLAWYGGSLYGKGDNGQEQFVDNVSGARVPPGSTFKTVTLVTALKEGISLRSTYEAPARLTVLDYPVNNDESEPGHLGWPDLVEATAESINTVYVPLGVDVGVNDIIRTARDMGVDEGTLLEDVAGVTLGKDGVSALDMTQVYSTLASGGYRSTPHIVARVEDSSGEDILPLRDGQTTSDPVIPPTVARDATFALQAVLDHGTGKNARLANNRPAAGKTGTTDDFRSAWFCGYTKQIASCVNMFRGKGERKDQLKGIPGAEDGVYGGNYPAKIWKAFMDAALKDVPVTGFDPPAYGGAVTLRSPAPAPTTPPSELPTQPATSGGIGGWDLFGDDDDRNGRGGQTGQQGGQTGQQGGQTGQQPTRPRPSRSPGGIIVDPFNN